uniref:Uncharacterized protein n=1 Tax=Rhodococcus hoagii TaxID=43767 RepID=A0A1Z1V093_RHOHA|nr:hypothetical protein pVAPB1475_0431 [Prescottella equi]ARX60540.1 hypothetical protein pVAPB1413_0431 [Prescottella equi]ARX60645.1 hypothetical protein pVAPB1533_0431 [Prescottella equi]
MDKRYGGNPYLLHGDDPVLAMAGLYELWPDPSKTEDDPGRLAVDHHRAHHTGDGRDRTHP